MQRVGVVNWGLVLGLALACCFRADARAQDVVAPLDLETAVVEALEGNLDLAAERRALAAAKEEIGLARAPLLPQVDLEGVGGITGNDKSGRLWGQTTQESATLTAELEQVVYDEDNWANFDIQKLVYAARRQDFVAFRLGVIQDAAGAFIEVGRSRAVLASQRENRELTRRNLETSRARLAAGWSSAREVVRWESQIAANDQSVVDARTQLVVDRFALNQVRNRPAEREVDPVPLTLESDGFVYADPAVAAAIEVPDGDRRLRDALVRVGLLRSPELAALDDAIAAANRLMTSNRRAFWLPSTSVGASAKRIFSDGSGGPGLDFDEKEWTVGARMSFPLVTGGAKWIELRQTGEILASLRYERRATAQRLDQSIRSTFARASGSFENIRNALDQLRAAQKNYDLVIDSYVLGVASILSLLDAQSQLIGAQLAVANARADFFSDLVDAERELAYFPFLEPPADVEALLRRVSGQVVQP